MENTSIRDVGKRRKETSPGVLAMVLLGSCQPLVEENWNEVKFQVKKEWSIDASFEERI